MLRAAGGAPPPKPKPEVDAATWVRAKLFRTQLRVGALRRKVLDNSPAGVATPRSGRPLQPGTPPSVASQARIAAPVAPQPARIAAPPPAVPSEADMAEAREWVAAKLARRAALAAKSARMAPEWPPARKPRRATSDRGNKAESFLVEPIGFDPPDDPLLAKHEHSTITRYRQGS